METTFGDVMCGREGGGGTGGADRKTFWRPLLRY